MQTLPQAFEIEKVISGFFRISGYPDGSDWIYGRCDVGDECFGMSADGRGWVAGTNSAVVLDAVARREVARHQDLPRAYRRHSAATRDGAFLGLLSMNRRTARSLVVLSLETGGIVHVVDLPRGQEAIAAVDGGFLVPVADEIEGAWQTGLARICAATGRIDLDVMPSADYDRGFFAASPSGRVWLRKDWGRLPATGARKGLLGLIGGPTFYGIALEVWEAQPLVYQRSIVPLWVHPKSVGTQHGGIVAYFDKAWQARQGSLGERLMEALHAEIGAARIGRAPFPSVAALTRVAERAGLGQGEDAAFDELMAYLGGFGLPGKLAWEADESAFWFTFGGARRVRLDGAASQTITLQRYEPGSRHEAPWVGGGFVGEIAPQGDGTARVAWYDGHAIIDGAPNARPETRHVVPETHDRFRKDLRDAEVALNRRVQQVEKLRDTGVIRLKSLDEEACLKAIRGVQRKLTAIMDDAAAHGRREAFRFETPEGPMTAAAFYRHAAGRDPAATEALEKLLASFERWDRTRNTAWTDVSANLDAVRQALAQPTRQASLKAGAGRRSSGNSGPAA